MMRTSQALLVLSLASAFALSACNSSQQANPPAEASAAVQSASSAPAMQSAHYHAALALGGNLLSPLMARTFRWP